jgi:hypothetical protein
LENRRLAKLEEVDIIPAEDELKAVVVLAELGSALDKADVEVGPVTDEVEAVAKPAVLEPIPPAVEKLRLKLAEEGMEFFSVFLETATVADLRPELQARREKVEKYGQGLCSKCRWLSGCLQCDVKKAWAYCLRVEMGLPTGPALTTRSMSSKGGGWSVKLVEVSMCWLN